MRRWRFRGLRFMAFGLIVVAVAGLVTTGLWNALMPAIFGLGTISFWQALGLLVLSRILFGQWGRGMRRDRGMVRGETPPWAIWKWDHLTAEERDRFRRGMGRNCGNPGTTETAGQRSFL